MSAIPSHDLEDRIFHIGVSLGRVDKVAVGILSLENAEAQSSAWPSKGISLHETPNACKTLCRVFRRCLFPDWNVLEETSHLYRCPNRMRIMLGAASISLSSPGMGTQHV